MDVYQLLETKPYGELKTKYWSEINFRGTIKRIKSFFPEEQHKILLDFIIAVEKSAKRNWWGFGLVVGWDSKEWYQKGRWGLLLYKENEEKLNSVIKLIIEIQEDASKDWAAFANVIGRFGEETRGLYWTLEPQRYFPLIKAVSKEASEDWKGFADVICYRENCGRTRGLFAQEKPEELFDLIIGVKKNASKDWSSFASVVGYEWVHGDKEYGEEYQGLSAWNRPKRLSPFITRIQEEASTDWRLFSVFIGEKHTYARGGGRNNGEIRGVARLEDNKKELGETLSKILYVKQYATDNWLVFRELVGIDSTGPDGLSPYTRVGVMAWPRVPRLKKAFEHVCKAQKKETVEYIDATHWTYLLGFVGKDSPDLSETGRGGGLVLWKDSKKFDRILEFILKLKTLAPGWEVVGKQEYTKTYGLILWENSKKLDRLLKFVLEIENSASNSWEGFASTIGKYEKAVGTDGLITWNESEQFEDILKFIWDIREEARTDWRRFAMVIGEGLPKSARYGGLILWEDPKKPEMLSKVTSFILNIREEASKNWAGFSTLLGQRTPEAGVGLIYWKDSPYLERILRFTKDIQKSASRDWMRFGYMVGRESDGKQKTLMLFENNLEPVLKFLKKNLDEAEIGYWLRVLEKCDGDTQVLERVVKRFITYTSILKDKAKKYERPEATYRALRAFSFPLWMSGYSPEDAFSILLRRKDITQYPLGRGLVLPKGSPLLKTMDKAGMTLFGLPEVGQMKDIALKHFDGAMREARSIKNKECLIGVELEFTERKQRLEAIDFDSKDERVQSLSDIIVAHTDGGMLEIKNFLPHTSPRAAAVEMLFNYLEYERLFGRKGVEVTPDGIHIHIGAKGVETDDRINDLLSRELPFLLFCTNGHIRRATQYGIKPRVKNREPLRHNLGIEHRYLSLVIEPNILDVNQSGNSEWHTPEMLQFLLNYAYATCGITLYHYGILKGKIARGPEWENLIKDKVAWSREFYPMIARYVLPRTAKPHNYARKVDYSDVIGKEEIPPWHWFLERVRKGLRYAGIPESEIKRAIFDPDTLNGVGRWFAELSTKKQFIENLQKM